MTRKDIVEDSYKYQIQPEFLFSSCSVWQIFSNELVQLRFSKQELIWGSERYTCKFICYISFACKLTKHLIFFGWMVMHVSNSSKLLCICRCCWCKHFSSCSLHCKYRADLCWISRNWIWLHSNRWINVLVCKGNAAFGKYLILRCEKLYGSDL